MRSRLSVYGSRLLDTSPHLTMSYYDFIYHVRYLLVSFLILLMIPYPALYDEYRAGSEAKATAC